VQTRGIALGRATVPLDTEEDQMPAEEMVDLAMQANS
jgi:hypothetical protein